MYSVLQSSITVQCNIVMSDSSDSDFYLSLDDIEDDDLIIGEDQTEENEGNSGHYQRATKFPPPPPSHYIRKMKVIQGINNSVQPN